jgi:DnaJ-domain-containing protein 1
MKMKTKHETRINAWAACNRISRKSSAEKRELKRQLRRAMQENNYGKMEIIAAKIHRSF